MRVVALSRHPGHGVGHIRDTVSHPCPAPTTQRQHCPCAGHHVSQGPPPKPREQLHDHNHLTDEETGSVSCQAQTPGPAPPY